MPKEETIQMMILKNVIGNKTDLPLVNARSTLSSSIKAMITKVFGVPQLIHLYGALGLNKTLTFDVNENSVTSLYSNGTDLYAGLFTNPGKIVKIDLGTFTKISTLTLDVGEEEVLSLFSDGSYLYAGLITSPAKIIKIDLLTFTKVSTLTLDIGENIAYSLFSDGSYLYAGLSTSPGKVVKIDLTTFTSISTLTFGASKDIVNTLFSDGLYLYAGLATEPGIIIKIDIYTFTEKSVLTCAVGDNYVIPLFSDGTYLYAGFGINPGKIVKIDIATFTIITTSSFAVGENAAMALFSDGTYIYGGLESTPGKIIRRYIIPSADSHQRKIDLIENRLTAARAGYLDNLSAGAVALQSSVDDLETRLTAARAGYLDELAAANIPADIDTVLEQVHTGTYYIIPANAAPISLQSAAGAYNKGNYVEIIPVNSIGFTYYIVGIYINIQTAGVDYEIDVATGLAASEIIIATESASYSSANRSFDMIFPIPIKVAANTRISMRCSDAAGSNIVKVKLRYKD